MQYIELDPTAYIKLIEFTSSPYEDAILRVLPITKPNQERWCIYARKDGNKVRLFNFTYKYAQEQMSKNREVTHEAENHTP